MTFLLRFGAACGVIAGLSLGLPGAIEAVTGETTATSLVLGVAPALAVPLLTALYLGQAGSAGRSAAAAYAVHVIGLGLFGGAAYALNVVLYFLDGSAADDLAAPGRLALLASAALFAGSALWFGVTMVRARRYPPTAAAAYAVVLPLFTVGATLPESLLVNALHLAAGATIAWLSIALWRTLPGPELATQPGPTGQSRPWSRA